jgi:hypothetical protein
MRACHARHADHGEACHDRRGGGGTTNHLKQSKSPVVQPGGNSVRARVQVFPFLNSFTVLRSGSRRRW